MHQHFSFTHAHNLSQGVGVSHAHALSISLSLSDYYVPLFSLILVGKHYFSHMHIYTRTVSTSPLYAHICAYVSPARTLSLGLSRTHCPPRHTSLLVVGRYDSIISFGRISLTVRLDGNMRQSFNLVRTLAVEEKAYSWYCILVIGVCTKYTWIPGIVRVCILSTN